MYDVEISADVDGSTVLGRASVTKDGKPFVDYTATYYNMEPWQITALNSLVQDFLLKRPHKGLTVHQMQQLQKDFMKVLLDLGDEVTKGKKK